ncbi:hypothetical protein DFS33DRAFT_1285521 [Desarmillaria ectypa]|nr:hypothetical protein DFS33DRAFT_1285521 [Desarmillaria ectypa]
MRSLRSFPLLGVVLLFSRWPWLLPGRPETYPLDIRLYAAQFHDNFQRMIQSSTKPSPALIRSSKHAVHPVVIGSKFI